MASSVRSTLFLTADAPFEGGSGGQIVSWRLIKAYADLGPVDVLALVPEGEQPSAALRGLAREVTFVQMKGFHAARSRGRAALRMGRSFIHRVPYRIEKFASSRFADEIAGTRHRGRHALVHCDHLALAQYRRLRPDLPAILCEHNVEWQIFERLATLAGNPLIRGALLADSRRTRRWEIQAASWFERILCLSEYDREQLIAQRTELGQRVVRWPVPVIERPMRRAATERAGFSVLILGSLRAPGRLHGTRWFVREVWPYVRGHAPNARLNIVGAGPPQDVLELDGANGIRVWGYCQDLEALLEDTSVCAIPLFAGAGIRVKVLEMISRGIPCIGTSVGLQGMQHIAGTVVVDAPAGWIDALCDAEREPIDLRGKAERGREMVNQAHSHLRATAVLREQVEHAIASYRGPEE